METTMTDMMINSDLTPGTAASASSTSPVSSNSPVPVTPGVAAPSEVGSSWGLLLVPILICAALVLYVSLI